MALNRRSGARTEGNIWAGFVDVMSSLLLVMIFLLSIFMISQFFLRETILGQGRQLTSLESQLASLAEALGATERQRDALSAQNDELGGQLSELANQNDQLLAANLGLNNQLQTLQFEVDAQQGRIADFEEQVASLIAKNLALNTDYQTALGQNTALSQGNSDLAARISALEAELAASDQSARDLRDENNALTRSLSEGQAIIDAQAAERAAVEALLADLTKDIEGADQLNARLDDVEALAKLALGDEAVAQSELGQALRQEFQALSDAERDQASRQLAAQFLRQRLRDSDAELTAMTLALEKERQAAEDTLTKLAAIQAERDAINAGDLSEAEKNAALLQLAQQEIAERDIANERDARRLAALNQQIAQLRAQLNGLQSLLDAANAADSADKVQIEALGTSLNAALARVAAEERRRANDLEKFRSDFFGRLRTVLDGVQDVEIVGDRFVFSSEVLFPTGSATLSPEGRAQISKVANLVNQIAAEIPSDINWILRVDGHTDIQPVSAANIYADNWELSQARALNVVRFMIENNSVDPRRLAATGFGEFHPIDPGISPEALARNRRIELKLTEQ